MSVIQQPHSSSPSIETQYNACIEQQLSFDMDGWTMECLVLRSKTENQVALYMVAKCRLAEFELLWKRRAVWVNRILKMKNHPFVLVSAKGECYSICAADGEESEMKLPGGYPEMVWGIPKDSIVEVADPSGVGIFVPSLQDALMPKMH